jgi:hypothetical protein
VDQAVASFRELLDPVPGLEPGAVQRRAAQLLPERLMHSAMDWWPIDATPTGSRNRLLIGIAVWSVHDLRLLDLLESAIRSGHTPDIVIGVFDIDQLSSQDELQRRFPGIGTVSHSPVAGLWSGGKLQEVASGFAARQLVAKLFGFDPTAILTSPTSTPR